MTRVLSEAVADLKRWADPLVRADRDRLLARLFDEECCKAWRGTRIRVDTGALRDALTNIRSPDRETTLEGGDLILRVYHPAVGYHPEYVPRIDFGMMFVRALQRYLEERRK